MRDSHYSDIQKDKTILIVPNYSKTCHGCRNFNVKVRNGETAFIVCNINSFKYEIYNTDDSEYDYAVDRLIQAVNGGSSNKHYCKYYRYIFEYIIEFTDLRLVWNHGVLL